VERPVLLGRRFVSKFEGAADWLDEGEWVAVGGVERDLPRDEELEVILRSPGQAGKKGRSELVVLKKT
jgi:hypothetical protein